MNITDIRITELNDSKSLAFASITLNGEFVVTGLHILNGQNGYWVAMPSRKNAQGEYNDIAFPITKEAREQIQHDVLRKYHELHEVVEPELEPPAKENKAEWQSVNVSEDDLPF